MLPTLWRSTTPAWDEIFSMRREVDRMLDRYIGAASNQPTQVLSPVVDVQESEDAIMVSAELPGVDPEDVNVTVEDGVLSITGEKRVEREENGEAGYHMIERRYGRFERSFTLPRSVNPDEVKAEFANGVLTVTLPKREESRPRRVEVRGESGKTRIEAGKGGGGGGGQSEPRRPQK